MAYMIRQGFEMPKRELLTLDGNPLNYRLYITASRSTSLRGYLAYLIQHWIGKAREAIKNYTRISIPEQGTGKLKRCCTTDLDKNTSLRMRTSQG